MFSSVVLLYFLNAVIAGLILAHSFVFSRVFMVKRNLQPYFTSAYAGISLWMGIAVYRFHERWNFDAPVDYIEPMSVQIFYVLLLTLVLSFLLVIPCAIFTCVLMRIRRYL